MGPAASHGDGGGARTELEAGDIVRLPHRAFPLSAEETALLVAGLSDGGAKNVSLDPATGAVSGVAPGAGQGARLAALMGRFADWATALVAEIAPPYADHLERGRTSFRPRAIDAAPLSPRKDDRRLHADAFVSRPTGGARILRVFVNINPDGASRLWQVGEPFERYARRWIGQIRPPWPGEAWLLYRLGLTRTRRTAYDTLMLGLHDRAKLDGAYQAGAPRREVAFPAGSSWVVFTDAVVHAAVAGRFALEQTFYLPVDAMADPAASPLRVLEAMTGRRLA
ncbi:MAG: Kdo hydroxylase family protein [Caulobacteraceae bacterium]